MLCALFYLLYFGLGVYDNIWENTASQKINWLLVFCQPGVQYMVAKI